MVHKKCCPHCLTLTILLLLKHNNTSPLFVFSLCLDIYEDYLLCVLPFHFSAPPLEKLSLCCSSVLHFLNICYLPTTDFSCYGNSFYGISCLRNYTLIIIFFIFSNILSSVASDVLWATSYSLGYLRD